ncbi:MAG: hypothetical protein GX640_02925, partial [Fibrobacter sp.]|nr:hypothetical protein [Fibrobacter sp.]
KQLIDLGMDKSSAVDLALPLNRHKERTILALMLNNKKQVWNSIVSGKRYLWKVEKNADKPGEVLIRVIQDKEVKSLIIQTIQNIKNNNLIQG